MIDVALREILVFLINVVGITLVITVFLARTNKITKWLFGVMTLMMFIWVDFAFFARIEGQSQFSLATIRIAWTATPILCATIYTFVAHYFKELKQHRITIGVLYTLGIFAGALTLVTPSIISSIAFRNGTLKIFYGTAAPIYFLLVFASVLLSVSLLIQKYRSNGENVEEKRQIQFLTLGLTVFFVMNSIFNLAFPAFFDIVHLYEFGDYSTVVFLVLVAISSLRHNFFGGKVITANFLVSFLGSYLLIDTIIFTTDGLQQAIKLLILAFLYIPLGVFLVRAVINEVRQKEELTKLNEKLKESVDKYLELSRQQKDIIDVMGHEMRTPITTVIQKVNLYREIIWTEGKKKDWLDGKIDKKEAERLIKDFDIMSQQLEQANALIREMLESARIDKQTFELNYEEFDLVAVLNSSINAHSQTLESDRQEIVNNIALPKMTVQADRTRILQAFDALITNAIKYGVNPQDKSTHIEVTLTADDTWVSVTVRDHGIGIDTEDIQKLGKKFVRLNPYTNGNKLTRPGGTGLGLFVVSGIMKHHGGMISIESQGIGKGSSFTLQFPIRKPEEVSLSKDITIQ